MRKTYRAQTVDTVCESNLPDCEHSGHLCAMQMCIHLSDAKSHRDYIEAYNGNKIEAV